MAHRPKTVVWYISAAVLALGAGLILTQLAVALSGPVVWILVAAAVIGSLTLYLWNIRAQRAHDVTVADAPSFGDALVRVRHGA